MSAVLDAIGMALARFLSRQARHGVNVAVMPPSRLAATLRCGDVLLVEGNSRFGVAIRYLTQSTWSHAALCVGPDIDRHLPLVEGGWLIEADIIDGVRLVPLSTYAQAHTRICRPIGLDAAECRRVVEYALGRVGNRYDLQNIIDLARYLIPTPPVPTRLRRRMLALGSGDPTRAICSTLIAQAFEAVQYPILPGITVRPSDDVTCIDCFDEWLHIRHHSLFVPRDFDVSPYFAIVKPTLATGFDPRAVRWSDEPALRDHAMRIE